MADESGKEELQRRLWQARRMSAGAHDELTKQRLATMVTDLESQLTAAEAKDTNAPSE